VSIVHVAKASSATIVGPWAHVSIVSLTVAQDAVAPFGALLVDVVSAIFLTLAAINVTIHRTRYHTCLHLAVLCICDTRALDAMDWDPLTARYGLLFMVIVAFCLYDTRCVDV
jgi:hypothetical protein